MVFLSIWEHVSTAFNFASMSTDKICPASSVHFKWKKEMCSFSATPKDSWQSSLLHASICKNSASTCLIFASNSSKGQILWTLLNWMGSFVIPPDPSSYLPYYNHIPVIPPFPTLHPPPKTKFLPSMYRGALYTAAIGGKQHYTVKEQHSLTRNASSTCLFPKMNNKHTYSWLLKFQCVSLNSACWAPEVSLGIGKKRNI